MPSFVESCATWLRSRLAWSNSRQSWEERLAGLLLLCGAVVLGWYGTRLALAQQVLLWGLLVLAVALLLRRGWLKLFGPVLFYDVVRTSRRGRYILFRCLYAVLLALLLVWVYAMWTVRVAGAGRVPARDMPAFAESFFAVFMVVQFAAVWLLTPGYTAGAVAEEKDRKTLEFLLATDLRNREIVLSKLASRLANLTLLILTGLPMLSLLQLLGGVDPNLVLAGFAATGLTMLSLAALSILSSVLLRKPRDAIVVTYLGAVAYLVLAGVMELVVMLNPSWGLAGLAVTWGANPVTLGDVVQGFDAGNIVAAWVKLMTAIERGGRLDTLLPTMVRDYALFHGAVALVCSTWAVVRLRAVALKEMYGRARKPSLAVRLFGRPRVGAAPMLWKEVLAEPGLRLNWLGRLFVAVLIIASFVPIGFIVDRYLELVQRPSNLWGLSPWRFLNEAMNVWVRVVGTGVACLTLLAVAVRASTTVGGERDRHTFDSLLTTPLDSNPILFAKWLGSILSVRWAWLWLALIAGLGLVTGGLNPIALPLLFMAWLIYAAVLAGIGLWFSTVARTTMRATLFTLLTVTGISVGHWLLYMCCIPVFWAGHYPGREAEWIPQFQLFGLTPPVTLGFLAFGWREFDNLSNSAQEDWAKFAAFAFVGLALYVIAAAALWGVVSARFRVVTGRTARRYPERVHRPSAAARPPIRRPPHHPTERPYASPAVEEGDQPPTALQVEDESRDEDLGSGPNSPSGRG